MRIGSEISKPGPSGLSTVLPPGVVTRTRGAPSVPVRLMARLGSPAAIFTLSGPSARTARWVNTSSSLNARPATAIEGPDDDVGPVVDDPAADVDRGADADLDAGARADARDHAGRAAAEDVQEAGVHLADQVEAPVLEVDLAVRRAGDLDDAEEVIGEAAAEGDVARRVVEEVGTAEVDGLGEQRNVQRRRALGREHEPLVLVGVEVL